MGSKEERHKYCIKYFLEPPQFLYQSPSHFPNLDFFKLISKSPAIQALIHPTPYIITTSIPSSISWSQFLYNSIQVLIYIFENRSETSFLNVKRFTRNTKYVLNERTCENGNKLYCMSLIRILFMMNRFNIKNK